jgi:hypothetical protein
VSADEKTLLFLRGEQHRLRLEGIVECLSGVAVFLELLAMPKDAKFGLVVGVSLVIVVAVFFFRKEAPAIDPAAATIVKPAPDIAPLPMPVSNSRSVQAKTMTNTPP